MYDVFSLPDTQFPEGFIWGSSTAGHQIEGNNIHSSHWKKEQEPDFLANAFYARSGRACNHYELWREDALLLKALGQKAYRMSIEWSRIEPTKGHFEKEATEHYVKELAFLKENGIQVFVTLIHFTTPWWFSDMGGYANTENLKYFERYLDYIVPIIAPYADNWNIMNEINLGIGEEAFKRKMSAIQFHARGYHVVKKYSKAPISTAHAFGEYTPKRHHDDFDKKMAEYVDWANNAFFFHAIRTGELVLPFMDGEICPEVKDSVDYWAINIYTRTLIDARLQNLFGTRYVHKKLDMVKTALHNEMYPEIMIAQLTRIQDKPVIITENGCCCDDDRFRVAYLALYLSALREAMDMGVDVRGYLHWSTMDNYEWNSFVPRFGLVDVNYETFERTPKPSAYFFKEIIENNGFTQEILRKYLHELPTLGQR